MNIIQMSGLYYLAGWVIHKLVRVSKNIAFDGPITFDETAAPNPASNPAAAPADLLDLWRLLHLGDFEKHQLFMYHLGRDPFPGLANLLVNLKVPQVCAPLCPFSL